MKTLYREWIGKKLRALRLAKGADQAEIAELINKTRGAYAKHEEGLSEPSIYDMKQLCAVYNMTIDEFLKDAPAKSIPAP